MSLRTQSHPPTESVMTNKGCYTCRRRRVVCDNGLPTCRKCQNAGKECLGYQKPLVWVKGMASRGKMRGRSIDDVMREEGSSSSSDMENVRHHSGTPSIIEDKVAQSGPISLEVKALKTEGLEPIAPLASNDSSLVRVSWDSPATGYIPTPWGLVDPLFKDFSRLSRSYMFHFSQHMVGILALYPNVKNPYRDLTLLVGDSPVLAHALSAIGAIHYALLANGDFSSIPWALNDTGTTGMLQPPSGMEGAMISPALRRPVPKAYEDFLWFKQRALRQLSQDLRDPVMLNDDRTVAAILALALLDAVESGSGEWKYHLEGAKNLLKSRQNGSSGKPRGLIIDGLDKFVVEGCLTFEIMGSTLARPGTLSKPFYSSSMGPAIFKRLEQTSFVGCPAYLLEVIFFVHAQWYREPSDDVDSSSSHPKEANNMSASIFLLPERSKPIETPSALLQHIRAFDPSVWAEEMQTFLFLPDLSARIALAAAYKAAVYLYVSRVLSRPRSGSASASSSALSTSFGLPADHETVVDELIHQLSVIPRADPHFKCLLWPTFIAGAEIKYPSQRAAILERLGAIYSAITSVNVRNAAWVLSLMWQKQDLKLQRQERRSSGRPTAEEHHRHHRQKAMSGSCGKDCYCINCNDDCNDNDDELFDWIQELDDSQIDWLFI